MYRILPVLKLSVLCSTVRSHSVKITAAKIVNYTQPINTNFVIKTILYSTVQSGEATFEEVKNVADNKSKNVLLIDVREPEELRETGVIPGSINIPLGHVKCALRDMSNEEFSRKYGIKKPDPSQPIIFSCKLGKRSANAQAILQQLGYKNVKNYLGGWLDWEEKTQNNKEKETPQRIQSIISSDVAVRPSQIVKPSNETSVFKETLGNMSQARFRKYFQRRVKLTEPEVVTIQDVKDVALYTCKVSLLSPEFVNYFHTKSMDDFLRSLIIYFQYYFQVWNKMQLRRKEAARKLRRPIVTDLENVVRDDLSDLRSMVSRNYAIMLLGYGDARPYHHMANKNKESLSDKDRRLFETLMILTTRVIWIALFRKYITLIEKELNRLLRTNTFSPYEHRIDKSTAFDAEPQEERVLVGKAFANERKLLHRSPATQELINDCHDYKMFAIGITGTEISDARQRYLEAAYSAPEELLEKLEVPVGVLGVQRRYMDPMLKPKEVASTRRRQSTMKPIPEFVLPPRASYEEARITETLPKKPVKYQETPSTVAARQRQCRKWRKYVELGGRSYSGSESHHRDISLTPSLTTERASVAPINSKGT